MSRLIITADDYGYSARYDAGILAAAQAGALDAVSAFAARSGAEAEELLDTGVAVGLHLDLGAAAGAPRAGPAERQRAWAAIERQVAAFRRRFGRDPAHLDGHHHGHAREGLGPLICDLAEDLGTPVRSINPRQRRLLRCRGIATPDLLIGRVDEREPALPSELEDDERALGAVGAVEWMVHPGYADPAAGSSYDAGREEDLELLLAWEPPPWLERGTHAEVLDATA